MGGGVVPSILNWKPGPLQHWKFFKPGSSRSERACSSSPAQSTLTASTPLVTVLPHPLGGFSTASRQMEERRESAREAEEFSIHNNNENNKASQVSTAPAPLPSAFTPVTSPAGRASVQDPGVRIPSLGRALPTCPSRPLLSRRMPSGLVLSNNPRPPSSAALFLCQFTQALTNL